MFDEVGVLLNGELNRITTRPVRRIPKGCEKRIF